MRPLSPEPITIAQEKSCRCRSMAARLANVCSNSGWVAGRRARNLDTCLLRINLAPRLFPAGPEYPTIFGKSHRKRCIYLINLKTVLCSGSNQIDSLHTCTISLTQSLSYAMFIFYRLNNTYICQRHAWQRVPHLILTGNVILNREP